MVTAILKTRQYGKKNHPVFLRSPAKKLSSFSQVLSFFFAPFLSPSLSFFIIIRNLSLLITVLFSNTQIMTKE